MNDKIRLLSCEIFKWEMEEIVSQEDWTDVELHFFPEVCKNPQLKGEIEKQLKVLCDVPDGQVYGIGCYNDCLNFVKLTANCSLHDTGQCLNMIAPKTVIDQFIQQRAYLFTSGWLENWRNQHNAWGLDQDTAQMMYQDSVLKLVLLDTKNASDSRRKMDELGGYLGLPTEILPVGLEFMKLYLSKVIADWHEKQGLEKIKNIVEESNRITADYAMALDLLTNLTQIRDEESAINEIIDLFSMLFSAERVIFFPIVEGTLVDRGSHSVSVEQLDFLQNWIDSQGDYYLETDNGFHLKLEHRDELIGVLTVEVFKFPHYLYRYLNISQTISRLCSLAIFNTRIYLQLQKTKDHEQIQRRISDTLREVMVNLISQQDFNEGLRQSLMSINPTIPFERAVIYLQHKNNLIYKTGVEKKVDSLLKPFTPHKKQKTIGLDKTFRMKSFDDSYKFLLETELKDLFSPNHYRLGVPLSIRSNTIGAMFLIKVDPFSETETDLAQAFANEISVALDNERLIDELEEMTLTDSLTGLHNRRYFTEHATNEVKRSKRYNRPLSALMLDLDFFKKINDTYGHPAGDLVIKTVAESLIKSTRTTDILARFGGEEFVYLLPETRLDSALLHAEHIRKNISELQIQSPDTILHVSVSIGVAFLSSTIKNLDELIEQCDRAMYRAKDKGRNCISV